MNNSWTYRLGRAFGSLILTAIVMTGTMVILNHFAGDPLVSTFEAGAICGASVIRFLDNLYP